ncbi:MAG: CBS domain-containing protein [Acidimicrobiia bacterium]
MQLRALVGDSAAIVGPETTLREVSAAMIDRSVAAVAVVDRTGLIGICTDRDLAASFADDATAETAVVDVMTASPDVVEPEVAVREAGSWMLETGYRHLIVMEDGELLGILDIRDVLWALVPKD